MPDQALQAQPLTIKKRAVAGAVFGFAFVLRWLPGFVAYGLAELCAPVLCFHTRWRERRIGPLGRGLFRNQRIAYRERLTPQRSQDLFRAWSRHMTQFVVDFCRIPRITAANIDRLIDLEDLDKIRALEAEGNGVIAVSGHLGMWELCGHAVALKGLRAVSVSRPSSNPALAAVLSRIRNSGGQEVISKWGVLWSLKKALGRGAVIGLAADENDYDNPCFVPFLGTLAATNTTPAQLAFRCGAPIVVVSCHRGAKGRFRLHVWDVIRVEKKRPEESDVQQLTGRISRALSTAIEHYPAQWLWGSRRFATRPKDEVTGADGLPPMAEVWGDKQQ